MIEPGVLRHEYVGGLIPSRHRDEDGSGTSMHLAKDSRDVIAIDPWHADVEQNDICCKIARHAYYFAPTIDAARLVALILKQCLERGSRVPIVFRDEDAKTARVGLLLRLGGG